MDNNAILYLGINEYQGIIDEPKIFYTKADADAWEHEMQLEHLRADEFDEEEWEGYTEIGEGSVMVFAVEIDPSRLQQAQVE